MSVVTDLQEARELILKEDHWTRNAGARNAIGVPCEAVEPEACQWCATGALMKVVNGGWDRYGDARRFLLLAANDLFKCGPVTVNDERGHKDTIEMFDTAIALAKGYGNAYSI